MAKVADEENDKLACTLRKFNQNVKNRTFRETEIKHVFRLSEGLNPVTKSGHG